MAENETRELPEGHDLQGRTVPRDVAQPPVGLLPARAAQTNARQYNRQSKALQTRDEARAMHARRPLAY